MTPPTTNKEGKKELTEIQVEMLKQMLEWDMEYSYPYSEFVTITYNGGDVDKKTLQKEMRGLISRGLVEISRGGIDEDTGMTLGGTGFFLNYERIRDIKNEIENL